MKQQQFVIRVGKRMFLRSFDLSGNPVYGKDMPKPFESKVAADKVARTLNGEQPYARVEPA